MHEARSSLASRPRITNGGPHLSIIIPTYNRSALLLETLEQICRQSVTDFELWIVDQSDPDPARTNRSAIRDMADPRLRYLHLDTLGLPNARNEGLARASGMIILFLDDDVILLTPDFLAAHLEAYRDLGVGGVTGRTIERFNRENARVTMNRITRGGRTVTNLLGTRPCDIHGLRGANMSFRGEAIAKIGGFDRNYTGTALLEEADFSERLMRHGWRLRFEPDAELLHLSSKSGGVRVENDRRSGYYRYRSTAYFIRKHRGTLGLIPFAATHAVVAARMLLRTRDPILLSHLVRGARDGVSASMKRPDQLIPDVAVGPSSVPMPGSEPRNRRGMAPLAEEG